MTAQIQTLEGKPKTGKTMQALRQAVEAARSGVKTLYFSHDHTQRSLHRKMEWICNGGACPAELFVTFNRAADLGKALESEEYRFLVVDGGPLTDGVAEAARRLGVAVLHVKHTRRTSEARHE